MTKIVVNGKLPKNPIVVEGFPSKGFVSTISANYLIRELGMKCVGYIDSDDMRGITVIKDSTPMRPIRIYVKDNIILIYSEVMVPYNSIPKISNAINDWLDRVKPKMVVLMAGITGLEAEKGHEIHGVVSDVEMGRMLENSKVKLIKDGVLTGVSSDILMHCIENKIHTIGLVVETEYSPDVLAAATMLEIINKLLNVKVNINTLKNMGDQVETDFKKLINQMKKGREGYVKMEECGPMYG
ncbi:MAG: PAC2 family protein [Candidatus Altiarchaeota archaeon]